MSWIKRGKIYTPPFDKSWRDNSALTPTAFLLNDETIRVYCGFRDESGVSRIGFVDVDSEDPSKILRVSEKPALETGNAGMFDDNGVILGDVFRFGDEIRMYYVGFQLVQNVKFLAFSGLAISKDNGETFDRVQETPVLDRAPEALFIRANHTVIYDKGVFKCWYATGSGWENINGKLFPQYDINYIESPDGINFSSAGTKCIVNDTEKGEYRIGRPKVYKNGDEYLMQYTFGTTGGIYQAGQAVSKDGISWTRQDEEFPLRTEYGSWDSLHLCYPHIVDTGKKQFLFYNGNNMGFEGFGFAEFVK